MAKDIERELTVLHGMTTTELCQRYTELHGQPARTRHRQYLIRKIGWRIQALAEGDLSERARRRAAELANDADVRVMPPKAPDLQHADRDTPIGQRMATVPNVGDPRLPAAGTALFRQYKGRTIRAVVLPDDEGFECDGGKYKTLTAVAEAITGSHINGFRFFRLEGKR